jgi:hypothetical protein
MLLIFGGSLRSEYETKRGPKNAMNPREFFINPAEYGLPTQDELVAYRIWDNHFHGVAVSASSTRALLERNSILRIPDMPHGSITLIQTCGPGPR